MQKKIIILNGYGGSGKDTFVDLFTESIIGWVFHISSIDQVKEAASILGWDGEKDEVSRKYLSDLKNLAIVYNDAPYKYISNNIQEFLDDSNYADYLFIDIREPKEIRRIVDEFGVTTILIKRPNKKQISSNTSDAEVDNYEYDYVIYNDGTLNDFREKVKSFIRDFAKNEQINL